MSEKFNHRIKVIRTCAVCGLESNPGGIGNHQRASGHGGWTDRVIDINQNGNAVLRKADTDIRKDSFECPECDTTGDLPKMIAHRTFTGHGSIDLKDDANPDILKPLPVLPEYEESDELIGELDRTTFILQVLGFLVIVVLQIVILLQL